MRPTIFSDEHDALRSQVRRWAEERLAPRAAELEAGGGLDALAAEAGALGYLGAGQPETAGGSGGDLLAAVVVAEELGRTRAGGAETCLLAQAHAGPPLLAALGRDDLAAQALSGGRPVALTDGSPAGVLNARRAAALVILGPGTVELASGWQVSDPASGQLGWHGADVGDVDLGAATTTQLARDEPADQLSALQRGRWWLMAAAAAVAGAWQTWDEARAYALEREAFGRPVATFQVNRHALADAATRLVAARELVHDVAHAAAAGEGSATEAAAAWWYATRTAAAVSDAALQLHGGYGYTMEYAVQRPWRDTRMHPWQPGAEAARDALLAGLGR